MNDLPGGHEEQLRLVFENAREYAIFTMDSDMRITRWNGGAERALGWSEAEAVGMLGEVIFTPEQRASGVPEKEMEKARRDGRAEDIRWHVRKDGSRFWANGMMIALRDDSGGLRGFAKILRDETERKKAEDALAALRESLEMRVADRTAQVQRLAAQLADAEAEGRRRVASILHDDVQQRLYGVHLGVGSLVRALEDAEQSALSETARRVHQWTKETLEVTRRLAIDFMPPPSDCDDLREELGAIRDQTQELYGFRVSLDVSDGALALSPEATTLLAQAVREALFNAVKYAGTDGATIEVRQDEAYVLVEVRDRGQGFDVGTATDGMGLPGLHTRMALVGGEVRIDSGPGDGTVVTFQVPREA